MIRTRSVSIVLLCVLGASALVASVAPAYTSERSLQRTVRFLADVESGRAVWEVGSTERELDLSPEASARLQWMAVDDDPPTAIPLARLPHPFVYRARDEIDTSAVPAVVSGFSRRIGFTADLEVSVLPREPGLTVTFILPPDIVPLGANLPGAIRPQGWIRGRRWIATFVAPLASGVALRASFRGRDESALRDGAVIIGTATLPEGAGWQKLPAWLPQDRTVWQGSAMFVVPFRTLLVSSPDSPPTDGAPPGPVGALGG
jgi:hypothetical protein